MRNVLSILSKLSKTAYLHVHTNYPKLLHAFEIGMQKYAACHALIIVQQQRRGMHRTAWKFGIGLLITWGVAEIDTQISQEAFGNRENPGFFIEIDRFPGKIIEKSFDLGEPSTAGVVARSGAGTRSSRRRRASSACSSTRRATRRRSAAVRPRAASSSAQRP